MESLRRHVRPPWGNAASNYSTHAAPLSDQVRRFVHGASVGSSDTTRNARTSPTNRGVSPCSDLSSSLIDCGGDMFLATDSSIPRITSSGQSSKRSLRNSSGWIALIPNVSSAWDGKSFMFAVTITVAPERTAVANTCRSFGSFVIDGTSCS